MRLVLDALSLDMMIVGRESCSGLRAVFALPTISKFYIYAANETEKLV